MKRFTLTCLLSSLALGAVAQNTPVGKWHSIDDKTSQPKAEIMIEERGGALFGKITQGLEKNADPQRKCVECKDDRKDKLMLGMEIIRNAKKEAGEEVWTGGKILDPENGREYTLKLTPIEGGKKLNVRGSFGPFGRTQTWVRVQ